MTPSRLFQAYRGQPVLLRAVDCIREPKVGEMVLFDVEPVKMDWRRVGLL